MNCAPQLDERERAALQRHEQRFGNLHRRADVPADEVRALFDASGYTSLKAGLSLPEAWLRATWPASLSHEVVYRGQDGRALGHVAVTRAYSRAWLGHEIATLREHDEALRCRHKLYQHFSVWPRLLDGDEALLFGYFNRHRPWHRRMFEDFAAQTTTNDCVIVPFDRYVVDRSAGLSEPATFPGLTVLRLGPVDVAAISELLTGALPPLAVQAFDLQPERLLSDCLHPAFAKYGIERGRSALGIRLGGKLVAVALCENCDEPLSLFNVLNAAQVFVAPGAPEQAGTALVAAVLRYYAERGSPTPLITCLPAALGQRDVAGCRFTETMGCIIWTARGLQAYEGYVDEQLAPERTSASQKP